MAIALVPGQTAHAESAASATSIAVSFPSNVGAGHLVTVKASVNDTTTVSNCQMTGETFQAAIQLDQVTEGQRIEGWYAFNSVGGQTQVTTNFGATDTFRAIGIQEWSGVQTSPDPKDQTASASDVGTAAAAISSPDKTPGVDGELIWGGIEAGGTTVWAANSPYTILDSETAVGTACEYQIQGSKAAVHTDFNSTGGTHWGVVMMTFKPAAGAAAKPAPPVIRSQAVSRAAII